MKFIENLIRVAWAVLKAPLRETTVQFYEWRLVSCVAPGGGGSSKVPSKQEILSRNYKTLILATVAITAGAGLTEVVLAFAWRSPTANQQTAFAAMDFAWKAGIGAIFGLLGGKAR